MNEQTIKRVVIVQEHLPHYRQQFYDVLHKLALEKGLQVELLYSPKTATNLLAGNLSWATAVPIRWFGKVGWQNIFRKVRDADLVIVPQESKYLANFLLQLSAVVGTQKLAIWGHGRNLQAENPGSLVETAKRFGSRFCDWWFAYNDLSAQIVERFGFPKDRITAVQNAIDTRRIAEARSKVNTQDLSQLRKELNLQSENVCVYTGGLYREKRLPFLFEACRMVREKVKDFELIVIGKGPDADVVKAAAALDPWIKFVGAKSDEDKVPYWALSKLLLMPGLVGLVVLDSFALGVPMVTTDYPYHSPEISYLKDGVNGVIVSPWTDVVTYAKRVVQLLETPKSIDQLRENALKTAQEYSVEQMAENFLVGIETALAAEKLQRAPMLSRKIARPQEQRETRVAVVVRGLAPYLCEFYDALVPESGTGRVKVFVAQKGTDWIHPWDPTLLMLRKADVSFVNARAVHTLIQTVLPSFDLFRALAAYRPHTVLVTEYSPFSVAAMAWATICRIPWVVATDIGPDYGPPYPPLGKGQRIVHGVVNQMAKRILALTPSAVKKAERLHRQWLLCPHSIDTSVYVPPTHPRPERDEIVLIAVGNFIPRKGYDLLFRALAAMTLPEEFRWTLKCFGSGSTTELSTLAESLGISDRVGLFSFAGLDQLIRAYQDADIFVHPCRADTYGIVVHEAAACGLPLVVSKFAGASETLIKEGENGYSVDPEDVPTFAERLAHLISHHDLRQTFGRISRQLAEQWDVKSNGRRAFSWLTQEKQRK